MSVLPLLAAGAAVCGFAGCSNAPSAVPPMPAAVSAASPAAPGISPDPGGTPAAVTHTGAPAPSSDEEEREKQERDVAEGPRKYGPYISDDRLRALAWPVVTRLAERNALLAWYQRKRTGTVGEAPPVPRHAWDASSVLDRFGEQIDQVDFLLFRDAWAKCSYRWRDVREAKGYRSLNEARRAYDQADKKCRQLTGGQFGLLQYVGILWAYDRDGSFLDDLVAAVQAQTR
jgi:hypothetical protein